MTTKYDDIISKWNVSELNVSGNETSNVKVAVKLLLNNGATFSNALSIAQILQAAIPHIIEPTEEFANAHPENKPYIYSNHDVYLAHFLLMLAGKAANEYYVQEELKNGLCDSFSVTCPCDRESCSLCVAKYMEGKLKDLTYKKLPPYHVGCRCGLLFHR